MKNNFFSAIQGKFKADFHGRYLGNILEQVAAMRIEVIDPLLKRAPLQIKKSWTLKTVQRVTTEFAYLTNNKYDKHGEETTDRRADLAIELDNGEKIGIVLIEIKVKDRFINGQLEEYIAWAKNVIRMRIALFSS